MCMIILRLPLTYRDQLIPRNQIWVNILGVIMIVVAMFKHMGFEICKLLNTIVYVVNKKYTFHIIISLKMNVFHHK